MASDQIVVVLDVDGEPDIDAVLAQVPSATRMRHVARLSDHGWKRASGGPQDRDRIDWASLGNALHRLATWIDATIAAAGHRPELYVAGHAPLSVFVALGSRVDSRQVALRAVNQRKTESGIWDVVSLEGSADAPRVLQVRGESKEPSQGSGVAAFFVSCQVKKAPMESVRAAVQSMSDQLLAVIEVVSPEPVTLTAENTPRAALDVSDGFTALVSSYPYASGTVVMTYGPSFLALAVGAALNPNQVMGNGRRVALAEYIGGRYDVVLSLPLVNRGAPEVPQNPASIAARARALTGFGAAVEGLRSGLNDEDIFVPAAYTGGVDAAATRSRLSGALAKLQLPSEPEGDDFSLNAATGALCLGSGLLHPLTSLEGEQLARVAELFTLHELLHDEQGIGSHNYRGLGRSGVVLEDADFWADVVAVGTVIARQIKLGVPALTAARACIDAHIAAMSAFDRMEQGSMINELSERRLRRYLIWHLQRARAESVTSWADLSVMLGARLFCELAPLEGRLDHRWDKVVRGATQDTVFAFCLGGHLCRVPRFPDNFDPVQIVNAVRRFDAAYLTEAMSRVVGGARPLLVPWL